MEIRTHIDSEKNLRYHEIIGALNLSELMAYLQTFYTSSDYDPSYQSLWNLCKSDISQLSGEDVERLQSFVSNHWGQDGQGKSALVASNDVDFGMSRMYELLMSATTPARVRVFRSLEKAMLWINE